MPHVGVLLSIQNFRPLIYLSGLELVILQTNTRCDVVFFPFVQGPAQFPYTLGDRVLDHMAGLTSQERRSDLITLFFQGVFSRSCNHIISFRGNLPWCGPGEGRRGNIVVVVSSGA